jgi:homogentisate solanesyltransferase
MVTAEQINKPFLPIAAKELTRRSAWLIVWTSLVAGELSSSLRRGRSNFTLTFYAWDISYMHIGVSIVKHCFSPLIFKLYVTGGILGTVYSVPPLQLKRYPLCAAAIIATVRGFLLNFGVYYAVREALGVTFRWNPVVIFIAGFMTVFASVIAVTKVSTLARLLSGIHEFGYPLSYLSDPFCDLVWV